MSPPGSYYYSHSLAEHTDRPLNKFPQAPAASQGSWVTSKCDAKSVSLTVTPCHLRGRESRRGQSRDRGENSEEAKSSIVTTLPPARFSCQFFSFRCRSLHGKTVRTEFKECLGMLRLNSWLACPKNPPGRLRVSGVGGAGGTMEVLFWYPSQAPGSYAELGSSSRHFLTSSSPSLNLRVLFSE